MSLYRRPSDRLCLPRRGRAAAVVATLTAAACLVAPRAGLAADGAPCTSWWDGGAGSPYMANPENWSDDRLPGPSDVACIGPGAKVSLWSGYLTVAALRSESPVGVTGGMLTLAAGRSSVNGALTLGGTGWLAVDGDLDATSIVQSGGVIAGGGRVSTADLGWSRGTQAGSGTTDLVAGGPGLALTGDGSDRSVDGTRTLRISPGARAEWSSGDLGLGDGGHVDNFGELDIRGDQDLVGCCGYGLVVNEPGGVMRRAAGSGEVIVGYALANRGQIEVETGTLFLRGGAPPGIQEDGRFGIARGATLRVGGSRAFDTSARVTGEGPLVLAGGVEQVDGLIEAPLVVDGTADVHANRDQAIPRLELRGGTVQGMGEVSTSDLVWTGGSFAGSGRTVVAPGGPGLTIDTPEGHGLFARTLEVAQGAAARWLDGTLVMTDGALLENRGLLDITGDLPAATCCDATPLLRNAPGGVLRRSGGRGPARIPYRLRNEGRVEALTGTLGFGAIENLDGGTLTGGEWLVRGTLEVPSAIARNAATLTLDGAGSRVQDRAGNDALAGLASNDEGGSLTLTGGREIELPRFAGDFENAGTVTAGPGSTLRAAATYRQTGGETRLADPTSRLVAGGGEVDVRGGRLVGPGTVEGTLRNGGLVAPSQAGDGGRREPGVLTVTGDYVQSASGSLETAIRGAGEGDHDAVHAGGAAILAGTLRIESIDGFAPGPADEFELLRHAAVTGEFDRVEGLQADSDHRYWPPEYRERATALSRGSEPSVSIGDVTVLEGDAGDREARFVVTASEVPTRAIHLSWATADGTATAPADYEQGAGTITIPHGEASAIVSVPVHGDGLHEQDETFHVDISDPTAATIGSARGTATIQDDDPAPPDPPAGSDPGQGTTPPGDGQATPPPPADPGHGPPPKGGPRRCVDRLAPLSRLRRPKAPASRRRRRMILRGSARDRGCATLRKVAVAVARRVRARNGRIRCRWVGSRGRLGRPARCDRPRWVAVHGLRSWRIKLRRPLPAGSYVVRSRAVDRRGNVERAVRKRGPAGANAFSFRVR